MRFTIMVGDEVAGMVQAGEESERDYRSAWVDIFVATRFQNQGVGTEAIKQLVRFLIDERSHHRITIDPAVENAAAIRCYEKAGFERVGVMKMASRVPGTSEWHDDLLMELVVRPEARGPGVT